MKTYKKAAARKLLLRFDSELKHFNDDLNALITKTSFFARNKQVATQRKLQVA